jgi:primosomal protein N' (replication factor Y)
VPDALAERAVPGARVVVPVKQRKVVGVVLEAVSRQPSAVSNIKPIAAAPDEQPALSPALLELGRWISDYYGAPLGLALRAILPGPLWSVAKPAGPAPATERLFVLAANGGLDSLLERDHQFKRAPKRRAAYETVEALGGSAPVSHLVNQLKLSPTVLLGLVRQGLARFDHVPEMRDPFANLASPPPPILTADQQAVVRGIAATPIEQPVLLHGVTGSGKTLVYLDVLRTVVQSGHGAILLVPEISLTPQTVARVRGVFGDQVAVLHSGLSDGERADAWRALRSGERRVAVGPRSAVFAPVQRLGAIVVDEEHDPSYKQGSAPRYHTRDVAIMRARIEGARLLLGSATPSLETLTDDRTVTFALPDRIGARPLPVVEIVDLRHAPARAGRDGAGRLPERRARPGRRLAPERDEQVILPLNRRGFATFAVSRVRQRSRLPTVRDRADVASDAARTALPLLRA